MDFFFSVFLSRIVVFRKRNLARLVLRLWCRTFSTLYSDRSVDFLIINHTKITEILISNNRHFDIADISIAPATGFN